MIIKDLQKVKAVVEANNWSIRSYVKNNSISFEGVKVMCQAYNNVIDFLNENDVLLPKGTEKIEYDLYKDNPNGANILTDMLYVKDAIIQPLIVLEMNELSKKKPKENNFQNHNVINGFRSKINEYENRIDDFQEIDDKNEIISEIEDLIGEIIDFKDEIEDEIDEIVTELEDILSDLE